MGVTSASMDGMKIRRRTRMVNDVPMEIIYRGMSRERHLKLAEIYYDAADIVDQREYDRFGWGTGITHMTYVEYYDMVDAEFRRLCQRAASKAGWHANKRNRNNKKEAVK